MWVYIVSYECFLLTGGAGVAEQIADLRRGSDIVVCTPGRMIDILCMQAGKLISLQRVTMVVMDEADRSDFTPVCICLFFRRGLRIFLFM